MTTRTLNDALDDIGDALVIAAKYGGIEGDHHRAQSGRDAGYNSQGRYEVGVHADLLRLRNADVADVVDGHGADGEGVSLRYRAYR